MTDNETDNTQELSFETSDDEYSQQMGNLDPQITVAETANVTNSLEDTPTTEELTLDEVTNPDEVLLSNTTDVNWTVHDLASREFMFTKFDFGTSHNQGTTLRELVVPRVLLKDDLGNNYFSSSQIKFLHRFFTNFRFDMQFTFHVEGTRFHAGALYAAVEPYAFVSSTSQETGRSFYRFMQHDGVYIDVAKNTAGALKVPWICPTNMFSTTKINDVTTANPYEDYFSRIVIRVVHPLQVASTSCGSQSIHCTGYVRFNNIRYLNPRNEANGYTQSATDESIPNGTISDMLGVDYFDDADIQTLTKLAVYCFGKPRTSAKQHVKTKIPRVSNPMAWGVGPDTSVRLNVFPEGAHVVKKAHIASGSDPLSISDYTRRWSFLDYQTIDFGTAHDLSPIYHIHTRPMSFCRYNTLGTASGWASGVYVAPTYISYASRLFSYWRGSFKFRIQFFAPSFMHFKFGYVYCPNILMTDGVDNPTALAWDRLQGFPHGVFDIQENHIIEFTTPYSVHTPKLKVGEFVPLNPLAVPSALKDKPDLTEFSSGTLMFYIVSSAGVPCQVPTTVGYVIHVAAGDDYELDTPKSLGQLWMLPHQAHGYPQSGKPTKNKPITASKSSDKKDSKSDAKKTSTKTEAKVKDNSRGFSDVSPPKKEQTSSESKQLKKGAIQRTDTSVNKKSALKTPSAKLLTTTLNKYDKLASSAIDHVGEKYDTFRELMKKYGYYEPMEIEWNNANHIQYEIRPIFPHSGSLPNSGEDDAHKQYYLRINNTLAYLAGTFAFRSGSVRNKFLFSDRPLSTSSGEEAGPWVSVSRDDEFFRRDEANDFIPYHKRDSSTPGGSFSYGDFNAPSHIIYSAVNPTLEYEIPHYTRFPIIPNLPAIIPTSDLSSNGSIKRQMVDTGHVVITVWPPKTGGNTINGNHWIAAGDDFSFYQPNAPPIVYIPSTWANWA